MYKISKSILQNAGKWVGYTNVGEMRHGKIVGQETDR
jgi:hypothetical protein